MVNLLQLIWVPADRSPAATSHIKRKGEQRPFGSIAMDKELKKALSDRLYEKRKLAALDLEQLVRDYLAKGEQAKIQAIISELAQDFTYAVRHPNYRNGGLIGLAAVSIALGQVELAPYLDDVVPPVLSCFGDADSRVRYYACESLYNVAKVAKGEILQYFNEIFDILGKLVADTEESVRNGADLVDRLLKDIVAEKAANYTFIVSKHSPAVVPAVTGTDGSVPPLQAAPEQLANSFSIANFVPVLVERVYVNNPSSRMFLVQWIVLLDSIPDLNLISYLAEFLVGLFQFLGDPNKEVRVGTKAALDGFLREIRSVAELKRNKDKDEDGQDDGAKHHDGDISGAADPQHDNSTILELSQSLADTSVLSSGLYTVGQDTFIDYPRLVAITLDNLDSTSEEIKFVALEWLKTFLDVSPSNVTADIPRLAGVLLPTLSAQNAEIRAAGKDVNAKVLSLMRTQDDMKIDQNATVKALTSQFLHEEEVTRLAALDWLVALQGFTNRGDPNKSTFTTLLKLLGDPSDVLVAKDIQLLAQILKSSNDATFKDLLEKVVVHFQSDRKLLDQRGKYVLSQLCHTMDPERIYRTLASIIPDLEDKNFATTVVQQANNILLMSPDLRALRKSLRGLRMDRGVSLFVQLFKSWSWNAVAALSLCLLAEAYQHAFAVLQIIASADVSVAVLVEIDRLVQLIEGPVFATMRMHLLEPDVHPYLYRCLYGLLMVLPQSTAFNTLSTRLSSIAAISSLPKPKNPNPETVSPASIDWVDLLEQFRSAQSTLLTILPN